MGISGSDLAYKQARSGVARAGATRAGYFTPNLVITINGTSVTVDRHNIDLSLARNNGVTTASFRLPKGATSAPVAGQSLVIGLGAVDNPLFAGQVSRVRHVRYRAGQSPRYEVEGIDWSQLFNRRLVTQDFSGWTATDIATTVVEDYTSGFTTYGIESGLATIDEFTCINREPLELLTEVANIVGGGFFIDARKIVHLWGSSGPSSAHAPTNPSTITNSTTGLVSFTPEYDWSQLRTQVIVEGRSIPHPLAIPEGTGTIDYMLLPYETFYAYNPATEVQGNYVRIGSTVFEYDNAEYVSGPPSAVTMGAVSAGDQIFQTVGSNLGTAGWATDGRGNFLKYSFSLLTVDGNYIYDVPYTDGAYGALTVDLPDGTPLYKVHHLVNAVPQTASGTVETAIPTGSEMVVRMQVTDGTYTSNAAAIEGGDGVHEHFISDGDLTYVGCLERATAELAAFNGALLSASWVTYDMNATPGAEQVINTSSPDTISDTLIIESVAFEFERANAPPKRACRGSTVRLETIFDAIKK